MTVEGMKVGQRDVPWASMGKKMDKDGMTAEEAIQQADLDWEVELRPLSFPSKDGGKQIVVPDRFAVVRTLDELSLGTVGTHYVPFQNREAFSFCDHLVDSGDANFVFSGQAKGGKQVVAVMKLPDDLTVAGGDEHTLYLLLRTSHDGTKAISVAVTPIRHRCTNVMSLSLYSPGIKQKWSVQHVSTVQGRLEEARDTLKLTSKYAEEYKKVADQLASSKLELDEFKLILEKSLPKRPRTPDVIEQIMALRTTSPNIADEYRGTAWGSLNAITEYMDWKRDTRSGEARFLATMDGIGNQVRNRATALLRARR